MKVLVVEKDRSGRALVERALAATGVPADAVDSLRDVEAALDRGEYSLALVDELAGSGALLDEVRAARRLWPALPVIATGTLLSNRVLLELLRLGVMEALPKPFTPAELRESIERVHARTAPGEEQALDYAAAVAEAKDALLAQDLARAEHAIRRAHAIAPLDPDVVALDGLRAECAGDDEAADRLYRVGLLLRHDEGAAPPSPREGLARLAAYRGARPVDAIEAETACITDDPADETAAEAIVVAVGLECAEGVSPSLHLRRSKEHAFVVALGPARAETFAAALDRIGAKQLEASPHLDVDLSRVEALRHGR